MAQTVASARQYLGEPEQGALSGFSLADAATVFGREFANQAIAVGDAAADVGRRVITTAHLARLAIPVTLAVLLGAWVFGKVKALVK